MLQMWLFIIYSIQQIFVMCHEISARINNVQNISIFCSFTVLNRLKALQLNKVGLWSDFWPDIIDTAVDQWRKHLQACVHVNGEHFEHLLLTNLQIICIFHVFLVSVASVHHVRFLLCWRLIVDRSTLLNFKGFLSLLRRVNEQNVKCSYFA